MNISLADGKPTRKFELNFQKEISEQIKDLEIDQLNSLFVVILDILSISFVLMNIAMSL